MEIFKDVDSFEKYRKDAKDILSKPVPKDLIKQREVAGRKLDYVEGSYVIRVLNKAFDNCWDWKIEQQFIQKSDDKIITKEWKDGRQVKLDPPKIIPQPSVCHVRGVLSAPGFGTRTGFGSKVLVGGASEQESCFKSANTDALKVAAKHFGIALDLYEDIPVNFEDNESSAEQSRGNASEYISQAKDNSSKHVKEPEPVEEDAVWNPKEILELQQLSKKLGLDNSEGLNPYIKDFSSGELKTYDDLSPDKLKVFLAYLRIKVKELK